MKIKFRCDVCEHDIIEEVLSDVTQYSKISDIEQFDNFPYKTTVALDYGESNVEGGDLSHYQCQECGFLIKATSPEELFEFLEKNNMLKEKQ